MFNLKKLSLFSLLLTLPTFAANADLDAWAKSKAKFLTQNCQKRSVKQWLKDYDLIEDQVLLSVKKLNSKAFEEISENDSFIIFLQVFYPQDIPEMDGSRGAYLGCITQFSSFLEAKRKVEQKAGLKAWGSCVKRQDNAPAIQVDLAKCLAQLKTE